MNHIDYSNELINFIKASPTSFHAVATMKAYLDKAGFRELREDLEWDLEKTGSYYVTRNDSSIIAFKIGSDSEDYHFQMTASHTDSPSYKVKAIPELEGPGPYLRLNTEAYGGMIDSSWFDKPLSLGGRVLVQDGARVESKLLYLDKDLLIIPNVAIHMNREINAGYAYNRQVDLIPLFSTGALKQGDLDKILAEELGVQTESIVSKDLFLVNRQEGRVWGYENEFVSSPKLDDLQCAFVSLQTFTKGFNPKGINVFASFDNEEVGSNTKQGAMSTFLNDSLKRINGALGYDREAYLRAIAKSFLVSCDNAHAVHPNHPQKTDETNRVFMNRGVVIKESANQKYTSDAFSQAIFKTICKRAGVPVQHFANRSDAQGGSTLGNLSNIQVSLHAVDIGLAQLAMHSSYETAGSMDSLYGIQALTEFYNTNIKIQGSRSFEIQ